MPLPCSPVSYSEESQHSQTDDESSGDSLTTPRPGPADPDKRSAASLSRPLVSAFHEFSTSPRDLRGKSRSSSEGRDGEGVDFGGKGKSARQPSVSFSPQTAHLRAMAEGSYNTLATANIPGSPQDQNPSGRSRRPLSLEEVAESSADENTAIFKTSRSPVLQGNNYGATAAHDISDAITEEPRQRKNGSVVRTKNGSRANAGQQRQGRDEGEHHHEESWFRRLAEKYGSVELENKGSVARDHLALGTSSPAVHDHTHILLSHGLTCFFRTNVSGLASNIAIVCQHRYCHHAALPPQHHCGFIQPRRDIARSCIGNDEASICRQASGCHIFGHINPHSRSGLSPLLRKPALCHPWQVPGLTWYHTHRFSRGCGAHYREFGRRYCRGASCFRDVRRSRESVVSFVPRIESQLLAPAGGECWLKSCSSADMSDEGVGIGILLEAGGFYLPDWWSA